MVTADRSTRPEQRGSVRAARERPRFGRVDGPASHGPAFGHLASGVRYFGEIGELAYDPAEDLVQCHLCGAWFRLLAGPHLTRVHVWSATEYREAFRLLSTEALCARSLSERQRANGRRRVASGEPPVGARVSGEERRNAFARRRFARWRSLGVRHPELLSELHPTRNGDLDPFAIAAGSHRKLWWRCLDGHDWIASVYNRAKGTGCPRCARQNRARGVARRTLAQVDPAVLAELHPTRNENLDPNRIAAFSHRKIWWRCAQGHEWQAEIQSRSRGAACPRCRHARRRSDPGMVSR